VSLHTPPAPGARVEDVRRAVRRQARAMSGITIAVIGGLITVVTMIGVVVLDYGLNQPMHRVLKLLFAGALGVSVLMVPWVGLVAFGMILPFLPAIPPIPVPGVNALNLMLGTVFITWTAGRVFRGEPVARRMRLKWPLLFMLILIVVSVVRATAFPTGYTYEVGEGVQQTIRAIVLFSIYLISLYMVRGPRARRVMIAAIVAGLAFEGVATILLGRNGRGQRAVGTIGQSNDLGAYLAIASVMAAALFFAVRNWFARLGIAIAVLAGTVGVLYSVSRAGIVALVAGLGYVALRSSRTLVFLLIVVVLSSPAWVPDYVKDRITGKFTVSEDTDEIGIDTSTQLRLDTWRAILRLVQDHPLDGVGFAGLQYVLPETGQNLGVDVKDSSHNTFLRTLSELGIFGLAVFLWILIACWRLSQRTIRAAKSKFDRQVGVALAAGTIALTISSAFGDRFFNVLVSGVFWIACALAEDSMLEPETGPAAEAPA
jgi:O-antigen ligase